MKNRLLVIFILIFMIFLSSSVIAIPNPSAVYCKKMGYNYKIEKTPQGERGICIVKPGVEFKAWDFFKGKVGKEYSYCAKKGYDIETKKEDFEKYSMEYAVCIQAEGKKRPMHELMEEEGESLIDTELYIMKRDRKDEKRRDKELLGLLQEDNYFQKEGTVLGGLGTPPSLFDWRNYNGEDWVTPVKDQAQCGSCWAFSAVGAVESKFNIDNNDSNLDYNLSEQQLVSCSGAGNCDGGWHYSALDYIRDTGIADEDCFLYTASNADCNLCADWQDRAAYITNYHHVTNTQADYKQALVDYGPLSIALDATGWLDYTNGIYFGSTSQANHAVVLVGYNDTGSYWIIKNSWGSDWGENGYIRLSYTNNPITTFDETYAVEQTLKPITRGTLQPYIINIPSEVEKNKFFTAETGVKCVDGYCGNVTARLDPLVEISYDDGTPDIFSPPSAKYLGWGSPGGGLAVRFTPPIYPVSLQTARFYVSNTNSFELHVWDDNGPSNSPGSDLIRPFIVTPTTSETWNDFDLSSYCLNINDGSFYIGWIEIANTNYLGTDTSSPHDDRSWVYNGFSWAKLSNYGSPYNTIDLMIRAIVETGIKGAISTIIGDTPFYTINQNPTNCTNMTNQSTCNQTWTVNATGEIGSSWLFYTIYASNLDGVKTNKTKKVNVTIVSALKVSLDKPEDSASFNLNELFLMNGSIECPSGADCGDVSAYAQFCSGTGCGDWQNVSSTTDLNTSNLNPFDCGHLREILGESVTEFEDSFEDQVTWTHWTETGEGDWVIETPSALTTYDGSYVAHSDDCDNGCQLTSDVIDLSGETDVTLTFYWAVDGLDLGEYLALDIYDGTWHEDVRTITGTTKETVTIDLDASYDMVSNFQIRFDTFENHFREYAEFDAVNITSVIPAISNRYCHPEWNITGKTLGDYRVRIYADGTGSVLPGISTPHSVSIVSAINIIGDFNNNGCVDMVDFGMFANHYGETGAGNPYDLNNDEIVDMVDFGIFANHYNEGCA